MPATVASSATPESGNDLGAAAERPVHISRPHSAATIRIGDRPATALSVSSKESDDEGDKTLSVIEDSGVPSIVIDGASPSATCDVGASVFPSMQAEVASSANSAPHQATKVAKPEHQMEMAKVAPPVPVHRRSSSLHHRHPHHPSTTSHPQETVGAVVAPSTGVNGVAEVSDEKDRDDAATLRPRPRPRRASDDSLETTSSSERSDSGSEEESEENTSKSENEDDEEHELTETQRRMAEGAGIEKISRHRELSEREIAQADALVA